MTDAELRQLSTIGAAAGIVAAILAGLMSAVTGNLVYATVGVAAGGLLLVASLTASKARRMTTRDWARSTGIFLGVAIGFHIIWLIEKLPLGDSGTGEGQPIASLFLLLVISLNAIGWRRAETLR